MDYGSSDTSTTTLSANQFPISEVYVPNTALTALEGGPVSTDGAGKKSAPASMYTKDGGDVTQGLSTDANTINSVMGRLTKIRDLLTATLTVGGTITEANSAAILADLAAIATQTSGLATQTTLAAVLAKLVAAPALEGGHLATIDTSTASAKTDLDTIATNTTGVATAANQATGNTSLSGIATNTTGIATQATLAAAKTDLDTIVTNTNKIPASPATEGGHLAAIDTSTATNATQVTNLNTVTGFTTDAAVTGDTAGTVSGKLRGLAKMLFDMWDSTNHWLQVKVMNSNANGQSTMVNSAPVVIASDQSVVPIQRAAGVIYTTTQTGISTNGNSADFNVGQYTELLVLLQVTAIAGTNVAVKLRAKDSFNNYYSLASATPTTTGGTPFGLGAGTGNNSPFGNIVRLEWVPTSATVTFTITLIGK